ncbi:MAG: ROK family protein [Actinomycetaceae bacterium]|nr:ROK family protein [Actinomycetaceae bacterium]MDY5854224.1 ROK family protein [Arcanobacterium sp.]
MDTSSFICGIDVGGTSIKAIVADSAGNVHSTWNAPTPRGGAAVVRAITELVDTVRTETAVPLHSRICVDVPGIVDEKSGTAVLAVNVGWENYPMRDQLTESLQMPTYVMQDARAGAYGEARFGAAPATCIYLPIGTGIASAILIDGEIFSPHLWTGEVGQVPTPDPDHPGERVALEKICSARAFAARFEEIKPQFLPAGAGANEVFRLRESGGEGSEEARYVIESGLAALADAIAGWSALVGPIPVVIGGGLGKEGAPLVAELTALLAERCYTPSPILTASRGSLSQALGTVAVALDKDF